MAVNPSEGAPFYERWANHFLPSDMPADKVSRYALTILGISVAAVVVTFIFSKYPTASYACYTVFGIAGAISLLLLITSSKRTWQQQRQATQTEATQTTA